MLKRGKRGSKPTTEFIPEIVNTLAIKNAAPSVSSPLSPTKDVPSPTKNGEQHPALDQATWSSSWYCPELNKLTATTRLNGASEGDFLVFDHPDDQNFIILFRHNGHILEKVIHSSKASVTLEGEGGLKTSCKTLSQLIEHYTTHNLLENNFKLIYPEVTAALQRGQEWNEQDVLAWLDAIGLGQYRTNFKGSHINGTTLLLLNDAELRTLVKMNENDLMILKRNLEHLRSKMENPERHRLPSKEESLASSMEASLKRNARLPTPALPPPLPPKEAKINFRRESMPQREQLLSFVDAGVKDQPYYLAQMSKDFAERKIEPEHPGCFVLYHEEETPSILYLLYACDGDILEKEILASPEGIYLKGSKNKFSNLSYLVSFYSNANNELATALDPSALKEYDQVFGSEIESLVSQPWFHTRLSQIQAAEILKNAPTGCFIIRDRQTNPVTYGLSYNYMGEVKHKLIEEDINGVHISKKTTYFPNLREWVLHYTQHHEELKCCLTLPPTDLLDAFHHKKDLERPIYDAARGNQEEKQFRDKDRFHKLAVATMKRPKETASPSSPISPPLSPSAVQHFHWCQVGVPVHKAKQMLIGKPSGTFVVCWDEAPRLPLLQSTLTLFYAFNNSTCEEIIVCTAGTMEAVPEVYFFSQPLLKFHTLNQLIQHYSTTQHELKCVLNPKIDHVYPPGAKDLSWYKIGFIKPHALSDLVDKQDGAFVVRSSESAPNKFALSFIFEKVIYHELVHYEPATPSQPHSAFYLEADISTTFANLQDLIVYHLERRANFLCGLILPEVWRAPLMRASIVEKKGSSEYLDMAGSGSSGSSQNLIVDFPDLQVPSKSLFMDPISLHAPWNFLLRSSQEALDHLPVPTGAFVVRPHSRYFGILTVSIDPATVFHVYLHATPQGLHLRNSKTFHTCLWELVRFYMMPHADLPVCLTMIF